MTFLPRVPSFVYLIPVVAFVGSGKPAGVVATMIFGSPPVIRFTVLGLRQVPLFSDLAEWKAILADTSLTDDAPPPPAP